MIERAATMLVVGTVCMAGVEGAWHEMGEASRDGGESWHPFFEMELERVDGG